MCACLIAPMLKADDVSEELIAQQQQQVRALMRQTATSYQTLKPDFIRIYPDTYTEEELDGLVKFYESPAGQAFVNKMPVVMTKTMELVQQRMQTLMPHMQERMKELTAEPQPGTKPEPAP